jgi:phosphoglycerate kinase
MNKLTIDDIQLKSKRVLIRVDFNVPIENGVVTDNTRIVESLPTIKKILAAGGRAILMSHLGQIRCGLHWRTCKRSRSKS